MKWILPLILLSLVGCAISPIARKRRIVKDCVKELIEIGAMADKATDSCLRMYSRETMRSIANE